MSSGIKIGNDAASLFVQRRLAEEQLELGRSLTRLSSGLRINKASDDAAGLAVSESLKADNRVFAQAVRNINDGISALSIAESALQELQQIAIRQQELAEQAANGVLSTVQRRALNDELNALVDEWNRITKSTQFNGRKLLEREQSTFNVQAGYGAEGSLSLELAAALARSVGSGTFAAASTYNSGSNPQDIAAADFNGDGTADLVVAEQGTGVLAVYLADSAGTFKAPSSLTPAAAPSAVAVADLNHDGKMDIVSADYGTGASATASIFLGNGDGTFGARITCATLPGVNSLAVADVNNDGIADIVTASAVGSGTTETTEIKLPAQSQTEATSITVMNPPATAETTVISTAGLSTGYRETTTITLDGAEHHDEWEAVSEITRFTFNNAYATDNIAVGLPDQSQEYSQITVSDMGGGTSEASSVWTGPAGEWISEGPSAEVTEITFADVSYASTTYDITFTGQQRELSQIQVSSGPGTSQAEISEIITGAAGEFVTSEAQSEITQITFNYADGNYNSGDYFTLDGAFGPYAIWFNVDNYGGEPSGAGTAIEVSISSSDSADTIAEAVRSTLDAYWNGGDIWSVTREGATITITDQEACERTDADRGTASSAIAQIDVVRSGRDYSEGWEQRIHNKWFFVDTPSESFYVWYNVDGQGWDIGLNGYVAGRTAIQVNVGVQDDASTVAQATRDALNACNSGSAFTASGDNNTVVIMNNQDGDAADIDPVDTGFSAQVTQNGGSGGFSSGSYFWIDTGHDEPGSFYVWFNVDGAGNDPGAWGGPCEGSPGIEVSVSSSDSPEAVATKLAQALTNAVSAHNQTNIFSATADGTTVNVLSGPGGAEDIHDGDIGFGFSTIQDGYGMNYGRYFTFESEGTGYYVWYNFGADLDSDPSIPDRIGIEVGLAPGDSAATIASKTASTINSSTGIPFAAADGTTVHLDPGNGTVGAGNMEETGQQFNQTGGGNYNPGDYFLIGDNEAYWFRIDGSGDEPTVEGRNVWAVDISNGWTGTQVAQAVASVMSLTVGFNCDQQGAKVVVTDPNDGERTDAEEGTAGGAISLLEVTHQGGNGYEGWDDHLSGRYFTLSHPSGDFYVWYNVDGDDWNPATFYSDLWGKTGIEVGISVSDGAATVASATQAAIDGYRDEQENAYFSASVSDNRVDITNLSDGDVADISEGDTGFTTSIVTQGEGGAGPTSGSYFWLDSPGGSPLYIWLDIDAQGGDPGESGGPCEGSSGIRVDIESGASPEQVAAAIASAIEGSEYAAVFTATINGRDIFIRNGTGPVDDITDGSTGFSFTTLEQGGGINPSGYFTFDTPSTNYYVWYNYDGSCGDPSVWARQGIEVIVAADADAAAIAAATAQAINNATSSSGASNIGSTLYLNNTVLELQSITDNDAGVSIQSIQTPSPYSGGQYFTVSDHAWWFNVDGAGSEPEVSGVPWYNMHQVNIDSSWDASQVADAVASSMTAVGFNVQQDGGTLTVTDTPGERQDATTGTAGDAIADFEIVQYGCDDGSNLVGAVAAGDYFLLGDAWYVWYAINSGGSPPGGPSVAGRTGIRVDLSETDDAETVAAKTRDAINNAEGQAYTASHEWWDEGRLQIQATSTGAQADARDGNIDGNFSVVVDQQGVNAPLSSGSYFLIDSPGESFYGWFNIAGTQDPGVEGRTGIEIGLDEGAGSAAIAQAIADALSGTGAFAVNKAGDEVTVTSAATGACSDAQAGTSNLSITVQNQGTSTLEGSYFLLDTPDTDYYVWYNFSDTDETPDPAVQDRTGVQVNVLSTATTAQIASATAAALQALDDVNASSDGSTVLIENTRPGAGAAAQGTTAFTVQTTREGGYSPIASGTYFLLNSPSGQYYVWYDVDDSGMELQLSGKTGIRVSINSSDDEDTVAAATAAAIDALDDFNASADGPTITVETVDSGSAADASSGTFGSGFTAVVLTQGASSSGALNLGLGNGTFAEASYLDLGGTPYGVLALDVTGDDIVDLVAADADGGKVNILRGSSTGGFAPLTFTAAGAGPRSVAAADFDGDGFMDLVTANFDSGSGTTLSLLKGKGAGEFEAPLTLTAGSGARAVKADDFNGDGYYDLLVSNFNDGSVSLFLGNGDGSFKSPASFSSDNGTTAIALGDFNGDGGLDIAAANSSANNIGLLLAETEETSTAQHMSVASRHSALQALDTAKANRERVTEELGNIGNMQSRLETAAGVLRVAGENTTAAASRITDVDVAEEAARAVKHKLLVQIAGSISAQANMTGEIALNLLRFK